MVCKATSISAGRGSRSGRAGATLVELVMSVGLGTLVSLVLVAFGVYTARSLSSLTNLMDLEQTNRSALDKMSKEIREVNRVIYYGTNYVDFEDADGATLTYRYSAGARTLTRVKGGNSTLLLTQCDGATFSLMQRNIVEGDFAYYPAEDESQCKVLGLQWACSRTILGRKANVTGTQTASIVIRKQ